MKRAALILLSAIYLLSSSGIAANSYYCCGKLQLTTLLDAPKHKVDCTMASQMKDCCKTKKQYFKIKDQHMAASIFNLSTKLFHTVQVPFLAAQINLNIPVQEIFYFNTHDPPNWHETPVYILNCNYRI